ncbi:hypothetical protein niasHS_009625 [Heterodera schachtii]|uniref:Uncharacterized protein n=1 Tax=Heterodera schachtii TaxID=97005 RepID=A0ABD2JEC0_HETSC
MFLSNCEQHRINWWHSDTDVDPFESADFAWQLNLRNWHWLSVVIGNFHFIGAILSNFAFFSGRRTSFWIIGCTLYALYWAVFCKPAVYSSLYFGWFFYPFVGYRNTNLEEPYKTEKDQSIWELFVHEIWPIFATNIRHLSFDDGDYLDNLRRHTSPTILTDLDQLNSIDSGALCPEGIADFDVLNPTAGQALSKWLHTPTTNGQPKRLYRNCSFGQPNPEWVNNFKEAFRRATTSVTYQFQLCFCATTMPIEQFELLNEWTKEKLTLKQSKELGYDCLYNWLLQRPLSPPAEEEKEEDEADQSNKNIV